MLVAVRNVAWGAAIAMAGVLAVALADSVWIILLWSDARVFFFGPLGCFDCDPRFDGQGFLESLLALVVAVWLIALAIRRASRSLT
jgi:hypothetical protein